MRTIINRWLPKGSMLRNITVLTSGTVVAQALMMAALPFLTRIYSPTDFSLLAIYAAIIGILTAVSCLRYDIAIPLPESDGDGMALLSVALVATFVVSLLCTLPVVLAPETLAHLIGQPTIQPYLWMVPLGVFFASAYNAMQYWSSRKKRFLLVTRTRVTRAMSGISAQLALGVISSSPFGLLFGHMIYGGIGLVALMRSAWSTDQNLIERLRLTNFLYHVRAFHRFPMFSVPEALFNSAGVQLPLIIIAVSVAGPEAGFVFLAMRVMGLPAGLIGSSVGQVFLIEAPQKHADSKLFAFTCHTIWSLFLTGAPVMLAIGLISPMIFPIVFGHEWTRAGWLVAWMTPWFILHFVSSPVSMVLHILGRQRMAMLLQLFGLVLRVGVMSLASIFASKHLSEIFALSSAVFYGIYLVTIVFILKRAQSA